MTDEAELLARIAARVAARRAGVDAADSPAAAGTAPRPRPRPAPAAAPPPVTPPPVTPSPVTPSLTKPPAPVAAPPAAPVAAPPAAPVAAPSVTRSRPRPAPARDEPGPDLTRFLAASEPHDGDDVPDKAPKRERDPDKPSPVLVFLRGRGRSLVRLVIIVAIAVVAVFLLRSFVISPYYIPSASMEPTLHGCTGCNDDHILVDKISYRLHDPRASDIVVFDKPANAAVTEEVLIKRVIATGGQTVQLRGGAVFVDNRKLTEDYVNSKCGPNPTKPLTATSSWTVPDGQLFVMGDNRCDSTDSRVFGPIKVSSVVGRAWLKIWPLSRIGSI